MEQIDETESNECAVQIQKGEKEADLCLHGHQLFPGVKVTLLYFLLKSLTGRRETMGKKSFTTTTKSILWELEKKLSLHQIIDDAIAFQLLLRSMEVINIFTVVMQCFSARQKQNTV